MHALGVADGHGARQGGSRVGVGSLFLNPASLQHPYDDDDDREDEQKVDQAAHCVGRNNA
jgi:hypothetical protein